MPIFCPLLLHKLYMLFGYLAEAGRYEKCKKHTFSGKKLIFLGEIFILDKHAFNKNCSQLKKKNFKKKIFFRNSGSGFSSGFYIFRIFRIFWIRSIYGPFLSKNFWIISNGWFMKGFAPVCHGQMGIFDSPPHFY